MDRILEVLLSGEYIGIMSVGILFLLFMSGVMAIVFIKYILKIMGNLESVKEIKPLVDRVDKLVSEIHKLVTSHEVSREVTHVELDNIKEQVKDIYSRVNGLEKRVG